MVSRKTDIEIFKELPTYLPYHSLIKVFKNKNDFYFYHFQQILPHKHACFKLKITKEG